MDRAMSGTLHSTSPRLSCYGDNAVECRSTLLRVGNSRVPVDYLKTTSLHSTLYHSLPRSTAYSV